MFDAIEIEKQKFSYSKYAIDIRSVDIDKNNDIYQNSSWKKAFKYFIGYKDNKKVQPLRKMLPKMSGMRKVLIKLNIRIFWLKMINCL